MKLEKSNPHYPNQTIHKKSFKNNILRTTPTKRPYALNNFRPALATAAGIFHSEV
ncbi:hypothetical protein [Larsenimonas rhizosphaerae]|uniref:Uncharacterized protein n=1 Tax=Larsenimonas rhizosphaerae TaxID=2944682 RepID=A0AA41ZMX9_9GAMM|nr:hypothetical protein [Larsenimonas rhizosphaerae]MCX2525206.1 hypothetical protein [Larsenimonas rhizosphaerae]